MTKSLAELNRFGAVDHFDQSATFESADRRMKETRTDGSVAFDHGGIPRRISSAEHSAPRKCAAIRWSFSGDFSNKPKWPMLDQTADLAVQRGELRRIKRYSRGDVPAAIRWAG